MVYRPLFDRSAGSRKVFDRKVDGVCQECSAHCGLSAYLQDNSVVDIQGNERHSLSRGKLCARGIAFVQGLDDRSRISEPAMRQTLSQPFEAAKSWHDALDKCAENLRKIKEQHGPESIAVGCQKEVGLDFALGAVRFAHLLGTPHIFQPYRSLTAGHHLSSTAYADIPSHGWEHQGSLFFIEADTATTHPVLFGQAMRARQNGARIIVADARFTRTMSKADLSLRIFPKSGNLLGLAIMKMMLEESIRLDDLPHVENLFEWKASYSRMAWEDIFAGLGLEPDKIRSLNDLLQENSPTVFVTGSGLAEVSNYGIWRTLLKTVGQGCSGQGRWYPMDAAVPPIDPLYGLEKSGIAAMHDDRPRIQDLLNPDQNGTPAVRAVIGGGDCFSELFAPIKHTAADLDLIVAFGAFLPVSRNFCHMLFPSVLWAQKRSLTFSNDRLVQWAEKIVHPDGQQHSGLDFWLGLAHRFGWQDAFPWSRKDATADPEKFYEWLLDACPGTTGCSLSRLKEPNSEPFFWTLPADTGEDNTSTPTYPPDSIDSFFDNRERDQYPLYHQTAPAVSHSTVPGQSWPWTQEFENENDVQIHPRTAGILGIENGEEIVLRSASTTIDGRAWISRMVPAWMVASPRSLESDWALVQKKNQTSEDARNLLRGFFQ